MWVVVVKLRVLRRAVHCAVHINAGCTLRCSLALF